jgi:hypothetical protein
MDENRSTIELLNLVANRLLIWVLDQFTGPNWRELTMPHELIL